MKKLTRQQQAIRDFIATEMALGGPCPSHREIAAQFDFKSPNAARCHLMALIGKGALLVEAGKARALRLADGFQPVRRIATAHIPLFGSIPAGTPQNREQEAKGCISVDIGTLNIKPSARTFALEVRGDSMVGKHILDGDVVIVEHGQTPRNGDVVAALIDGESTLKTFVADKKTPHLKAENPEYPKLIPAGELVIQGVMVALIRKRK